MQGSDRLLLECICLGRLIQSLRDMDVSRSLERWSTVRPHDFRQLLSPDRAPSLVGQGKPSVLQRGKFKQ
jgi:hypothetical protein